MDPADPKMLYAADVSAPAHRLGLQRRRPGLAASTRAWTPAARGASSQPACPRATPAASASTSIARTPTSSTPASRTKRRRRVSLRGQRRKLDQDEQPQSAADVLQPDPHRSQRAAAHLRATASTVSRLRRRRQDVPQRRIRGRPLGSSRDVDQPAQFAAHHRRQRRRRVGAATIARRRGNTSTTTRSASSTTWTWTCSSRITSTAACRTTRRGAARARCASAGHRQRTLVPDALVRRDVHRRRSVRRELRLHQLPERPHRPLRPQDRRAQEHHAAGRSGTAAARAGTGRHRSWCRLTMARRSTPVATRFSNPPTEDSTGP